MLDLCSISVLIQGTFSLPSMLECLCTNFYVRCRHKVATDDLQGYGGQCIQAHD